MPKNTTCIALSAFGLLLAFGTTTASARTKTVLYQLVLDCHNAKFIHKGTDNELKVTFITSSGKYRGQGLVNWLTCTERHKAFYRTWADLRKNEKLKKITIETTSDDGFWAKSAIATQRENFGTNRQAETYRGRWDVGFGQGFCLSTDASDANSQGWFGSQGGDPSLHIWGAGCVRKITLNVDGPIQAN